MNKYHRYFLRLQEEDNGHTSAPANASAATKAETTARVAPPTLPAGSESGLDPYIKELRNEAASFRMALRDAEKENVSTKEQLAALQAQLKAAQEAVEQRVAEAKQQVTHEFAEKTRVANLKAAVKDVLMDPDELDALDTSTLKLAETGAIEGLETFLESLKAKRPYLFKDYNAPATSTAAVFNRAVRSDGKALVDATTMTKEEAAKAKADFLRNNR